MTAASGPQSSAGTRLSHIRDKLRTAVLTPVRAMRLRYLPLLMIYYAYGALGLVTIAETFCKVPFEVNLWQAQNIWNDLLRRSDKSYWNPAWRDEFRKLGEAMNIRVDQLVTEEGVSAF